MPRWARRASACVLDYDIGDPGFSWSQLDVSPRWGYVGVGTSTVLDCGVFEVEVSWVCVTKGRGSMVSSPEFGREVSESRAQLGAGPVSVFVIGNVHDAFWNRAGLIWMSSSLICGRESGFDFAAW